eukprot:5840067-Alexandrium_andersonii.AAC.1
MVSCLRDPADGALTFAPLRLDAALRHAWQPVFEAPAGVEGDSALASLWEVATRGLRHDAP